MKKIVLDLAVTLDGFIEGPNGEIDWCIMDDDMGFDDFMLSIDAIFYGRVSYDAWGNFMPEDSVSEAETKLWKDIHSKKKYVFSHESGKDNRATFIDSNIAERVAKIKAEPGKNIWLYGGAGLIKTFIQLKLIDIYRISVHPVALGGGKPLFEELQDRLNLSLIETKVFKSGVVQLIYRPSVNH